MRNDPDRNSSEKQFSMNVSCRVGEIPVDGVSVLRTFAESQRIIRVFASVLIPLETGLVFREHCWAVMSDDATDPSTPCTVFQTCYRIHAEKEESAGTTSEHAVYLRDFILQSQSEKMRTLQLVVQNTLVQELGSIQAATEPDRSALHEECPAC